MAPLAVVGSDVCDHRVAPLAAVDGVGGGGGVISWRHWLSLISDVCDHRVASLAVDR